MRRQLEMSEQYARAHGLQLVEPEKYRDLGVSAFKGKHRTEGALGAFIKDVERGVVLVGSWLLVENLDRLGRDAVMEQLTEFLNLIKLNVTVVTLNDNQIYNKQTIKDSITPLLISLVYMSRSNNESVEKSRRIAAAWEARRRKAASQPITSICPGWLRMKPDKSGFEPIAERVQIVQRIFAMKRGGQGQRRIATQLTREGVDTWPNSGRKARGWHPATVRRILHTRAVLGEFQPHAGPDLQPAGEPVQKYFPSVITQAEYDAVQSQPTPLGPKRQMSTIFTGLCWDGYKPDTTMVYSSKSGGRWNYLVSTNRRENPGEPHRAVNYARFEKAFLTWALDLDWQEILQEGQAQQPANAVSESQQVEAECSELTKKITRLTKRIENDDNAPTSIVDSIRKLESQLVEKQGELTRCKAQQTALALRTADIQEGVDKLRAMAAVRDPETRRLMAAEIRRRVEKIFIFNVTPISGVEILRANGAVKDNETMDTKRPCARVVFPNGVQRWFWF